MTCACSQKTRKQVYLGSLNRIAGSGTAERTVDQTAATTDEATR
jgi:hypothetical protein